MRCRLVIAFEIHIIEEKSDLRRLWIERDDTTQSLLPGSIVCHAYLPFGKMYQTYQTFQHDNTCATRAALVRFLRE